MALAWSNSLAMPVSFSGKGLWILAHSMPSGSWETEALPQAVRLSGCFLFLCMFSEKSSKCGCFAGQLVLGITLLYPV